MADITVCDLNKYYGSNHVLRGVSFEVQNGEKMGLLGKNGSGKTTVFKILAGLEEYEGGEVMEASGKKIEILEQIPAFPDGLSVERVLQTAFEELFALFDEMGRLEKAMGTNDDPKLLDSYGQLQTKYEALGGYNFDNKIDKICNGMNISGKMRGQQFATLSGGEKTRVNLARILLREADILLLDEPTNHLDLISLQWLENYLKEYNGTVVAISHDRCFLDNVVRRIIEIEDGRASYYEGNYSYYAVEKEKRYCLQAEKYQQQQKKIEQMEAAAKRMHEWAKIADNKAMHRRAFSIEKRIERMDKIDKPRTDKRLTSEFQDGSFSGVELVSFNGLSKSYGSKRLFCSVDLKIQRNDRIALIGDNGCGKSTLVKLLLGEEKPEEGNIAHGNSLRIAYMPQSIEFENKELSVLENLRYLLEISEEKARNILAAYNFKGKDVFKRVGELSGGEKSRLKLCMLMQRESNLLVLDEPTNHLDIASREWIEGAIEQYDGSILFISHDRYFLNKFANRIWSMKKGRISDYKGSFAEYCRWSEHTAVLNSTEKPAKAAISVRSLTGAAKVEKEQFDIGECQKLEKEIGQEEDRLREIEVEMNCKDSDFELLNELYKEKSNIEHKLEALYSKWDELSDKI